MALKRLSALQLSRSESEAIELAPKLEALGYHRYWLSEHQPQASPLVMLPVLAGITERIRVGAGAVLLCYYPAQAVLHSGISLNYLFDDRIDLGLGGGGIASEEQATPGRDRSEVFGAKLQEIGDEVRRLDHPHIPATWCVGSSCASATRAAAQGFHFACSILHRGTSRSPQAIREYRAQGGKGQVIVAASGICAITDEQAARSSSRPVVGVNTNVTGDGERCADYLIELAEEMEVEEIMFASICDEPEQQFESYRILIEAIRARGYLATAENHS